MVGEDGLAIGLPFELLQSRLLADGHLEAFQVKAPTFRRSFADGQPTSCGVFHSTRFPPCALPSFFFCTEGIALQKYLDAKTNLS